MTKPSDAETGYRRARLERIQETTGEWLGDDMLLDQLDAAVRFADLVQAACDQIRATEGLEPLELDPYARRVLLLTYAVDRRQRKLAFEAFRENVVVPAANETVRVATT